MATTTKHDMTGHTQREVRCGNCRRLLAKGEAIDLTIKCPRCGCMNHVRGTAPGTEGQRASRENSHGPTD